MLDYIQNFKTKPTGATSCGMTIFRPVTGGVVHSDDFRVDASSFISYSADEMIRAGVDMSKSAPFDDVSLDSLDGVEEQAERIIDSEHLTVKSDNQ